MELEVAQLKDTVAKLEAALRFLPFHSHWPSFSTIVHIFLCAPPHTPIPSTLTVFRKSEKEKEKLEKDLANVRASTASLQNRAEAEEEVYIFGCLK